MDREKYAEELMFQVSENLSDNEYLDKMTCEFKGDEIKLLFYIKPVPDFIFADCIVTVDDTSDVNEDANEITLKFLESATPKGVRIFSSFIRDIERWGTG